MAKELGVEFYETSAKTGENIEGLFMFVAEEVKRRLDQEEKVGVLSYTGSKLHKKEEKTSAKSDCC